jgi:hypothetical protein
MKEKFTVRRSEDGNQVLHQLNNQLFCNVEALSADKSVEDYESGTTFLMSVATAMTVTLPKCQKGLQYTFVWTAIPTADSHIINADSTNDTLLGAVAMIDEDTTVVATNAGATTAFAHPALADHQVVIDAATTNTTKGGEIGSWLRYTGISETQWLIEGCLLINGTVATPFT